MTATGERTADLIDRLAREVAATATDRATSELLDRFVRCSLRDVRPDDLVLRGDDVVVAAARAHWALGRQRAPGHTAVQVVGPDSVPHGWRSRHSALMVVTDDVPFLVDTIRMALEDEGVGIHLIVHPILRVRRDDAGMVVGFPTRGGHAEAWTLIEIDRCGAERARQLADRVRAAVEQLHVVVGDLDEMRARAVALASDLESVGGDRALEATSAARFIDWLGRRHFVFLGAADYDVDGGELRFRPSTGLGIWRADHPADPAVQTGDAMLSIARTQARSPVHRPARMSCISVAERDDDGRLVGIRRIVGLFSAAAYRESVLDIPLVRERVAEVTRRAGYPADSHSGRALRQALETFPRDVLFEIDTDTLAEVTEGIVALQDRQVVRAFAVVGPGQRDVTVLLYLPRIRFAAGMAERLANLVATWFDAEQVEHETLISGGLLARVAVTVERPRVDPASVDVEALTAAVDELTVSWQDRLRDELSQRLDDERARALMARFDGGFPQEYTAGVAPSEAADDVLRLVYLVQHDRRLGSATRVWSGADNARRFRVWFRGGALTLSDLLPLLEYLGFVVIDQRPYRFEFDGEEAWLYDIGVRIPAGVELTPRVEHHLHQLFSQLVQGDAEADGFDRLVLLAGLTGRQIEVLRAYARYLRQIGSPFSQGFMEDALARHADIAADLVSLFEHRFDPAVEGHRDVLVDAMRSEVLAALDAVPSLDDDRVGRTLLALIDATVRTNVFQRDSDGRPPEVVALKFDPLRIPDLPRPVPAHEIWVCSPRVEGVHLRGGDIARGGLRWSDRREDLRTEILGLMKAQMVKNAVIVPTGAKGGFVVKRPPAGEEPGALAAEGRACYRAFIGGLLDVTDNIVDGDVVHPEETVCYDRPDPYLVVAADKGTATFSDVANEIALERRFWLGDAFASGGRTGYDHKALGITARGAWESVRRHARVLGKDADRDELTVVGIGDMSGDVFGNGMLLSPHLRLVAAFDHRHVFLDPSPHPAVAHAERRRLFELPRSSWADYDPALISPGGGVFSRAAKSIPLSPEVRQLLDVDAVALTPAELISAVLCAPVDLLWNGGIGTYVKASTETHAEVGDRANDAVRVDANRLRCRMVVEGGNLGFTQRARVEYALAGGLIHTDAIDNSAGVDCSDHEVNLKILLDHLVSDGVLAGDERNAILEGAASEVAELVLEDNRAQTLALTIARWRAPAMVDVHLRYLQLLEAEGWLDRSLEALPTDKVLAERQANGQGLTPPEFAVMLAYTKAADVVEVLASDVPDDPHLRDDLLDYFPAFVRERFADSVDRHRLRREILATQVVNQMVNLQGISFDHRMTEETGLPVAEVCRAWLAARDVLGLPALWRAVDQLDRSVPLDVQLELFSSLRRLAERATLWLLRRGLAGDVGRTVATYQSGIDVLAVSLRAAVVGELASRLDALEHTLVTAGVPSDLAARSAVWPVLHTGFDLVELAHRYGRPMTVCAAAYWGVFDELDLLWLWDQVAGLPRARRWESQSRSALREDLLAALAALADSVLASGRNASDWAQMHDRAVTRLLGMLREIRRDAAFDLPTLTVAVRQVRNLALAVGGSEPGRAPGR